ncbi:MAG: undecaprenyldiphospho-muramoylpentapeptide beta-N-acetylglucosaminyltransferase [Clostridiales Family XIII bacterium]|nr:undecaprenyldiphospho-muramoylpentapeptide beta-N-acetylglucosaminyltransferase [Clostridiales Family XIII bacterium]
MAGSATGGHLYPALAVAERIKRRRPDAEFLFIAARWESSSDILNESGYGVQTIDARGFDRSNIFKNFSVLIDLARSDRQIREIFAEFQPDFVFGTGGYVCGPVVKAARKRGIPTYLHEQNVIPGVANKLAEKYADTVFVAFEESKAYFKHPEKIVVTGNPVRKSFITAGAMHYRQQLLISPKDLAVMIFGGSQGADRLNEVVCDMLADLKDSDDLTVFFLTGRRLYEDVRRKMTDSGAIRNEKFHVIDYTETIHEYYSAADLVVGRSGAMTVSELAVLGKASILIPSPNVTNNHQYYNAKTLADHGGAIIMNESELTAASLTNEILRLKANKEQLNRMAEAAEKQGKPDAAGMIADVILKK